MTEDHPFAPMRDGAWYGRSKREAELAVWREAEKGLQAIALQADLRQAYRIDDAGNAIASDDPVQDFSVRNLGLQIRYRFELAPLSYLYVVYGRGGYEQEVHADGSSRLLRDSFSLRDDEQLLVKLSYRFES